jgi:hypothetical protein
MLTLPGRRPSCSSRDPTGTSSAKDLRLSIVVEAGHRYLLTCSNVDGALWAAELIDESEALRTVTPSASGAVPLALTVVVADMSFSISGGDIQQLTRTEALGLVVAWKVSRRPMGCSGFLSSLYGIWNPATGHWQMFDIVEVFEAAGGALVHLQMLQADQ